MPFVPLRGRRVYFFVVKYFEYIQEEAMKKMLESLREASRRAIEEAVDMDALEALRVR